MIFSRAFIRNLKHKTKKGIMLKIGKTESQPEDINFKHFLSTLDEVKKQLREIYSNSCSVAVSGKRFNEKLEKICGFGIRSEEVFTKETEFLNTLEDRVCSALGRIVNKDINTLDEMIVQYKTAKLNFDSLHFKTVQEMRKRGITVTVEKADDVMQFNPDLPSLNAAYLMAKQNVRSQCDIILAHIQTKVYGRLEELREVSNAQHHQVYCRYFKERLAKTVELCNEEITNEDASTLKRTNTFSYYRSNPSTVQIAGSQSAGIGSTNGNITGNNGTRSFAGGNGQRIEHEKDAEQESLESDDNAGVASIAK